MRYREKRGRWPLMKKEINQLDVNDSDTNSKKEVNVAAVSAELSPEQK